MRRMLIAALTALTLVTPALAQTRWVGATAYPDSNYHTQNLREFLRDVEQATDGRLTVQVHSNGSLLSMPQIKRAVQTGQIQLGEFLLAAYGNEDPLFEVDFIPFLADTWANSPLIKCRRLTDNTTCCGSRELYGPTSRSSRPASSAKE